MIDPDIDCIVVGGFHRDGCLIALIAHVRTSWPFGGFFVPIESQWVWTAKKSLGYRARINKGL